MHADRAMFFEKHGGDEAQLRPPRWRIGRWALARGVKGTSDTRMNVSRIWRARLCVAGPGDRWTAEDPASAGRRMQRAGGSLLLQNAA